MEAQSIVMTRANILGLDQKTTTFLLGVALVDLLGIFLFCCAVSSIAT